MRANFIKEQIDKIISLYLSGLSASEIAIKYNVSNVTILKILKRNNIPRRLSGVRKYPINENFFDIVDTKEKAYIFGLLVSDGSNNEKEGKVYLQLQERDLHILETIRNLIQPDKPLRFIKSKSPNHQNAYCLQLASRKLSNDLAKWGIISNKTYKITWPEWMPMELVPSFLLGLWDGDATIAFNGTAVNSTEAFCLRLKEIISEQLGKNCIIYKTGNPNTNIRYLKICGRAQMQVFLDWIYKDKTIYLERKYKQYLQICNPPPCPSRNTKRKILLNEDGSPYTETQKRERKRLRDREIRQYKRDYIKNEDNFLSPQVCQAQSSPEQENH